MWEPCSGLESFGELVWLPRLLQKARRSEESRSAGRDLMNGYLFGDNDFIDRCLLRFLRIDDTAVRGFAREHSDDSAAMRAILQHSGRSEGERAEFSRRLRRQFLNFCMLEADEGRLQPAPLAALVRLLYNGLIVPPATLLYQWAERKRETPRSPRAHA
ncbi:hypothetical protein EPN52_03990 [bacterium]|nr:MAG: hypothetical protein EPN52_03990 [bacterium]